MAKKIEIKIGPTTLFEIPIDHLDGPEVDMVKKQLELAQKQLNSGKPASATLAAGSALLIPTILGALRKE